MPAQRASTVDVASRGDVAGDDGQRRGGRPVLVRPADAPRRVERIRRTEWMMLVGTDTAALALAGVLSGEGSWLFPLYAVGALIAVGAKGLHTSRMTLRVLDDVPRLMSSLALPLLVLAAVAWLAPGVAGIPYGGVALGALLVVLGRAVVYGLIRQRRRSGAHLQRTIIVGAGEVAEGLASRLLDDRGHGLEPIGYVDAPEMPQVGRDGPAGLPLLGHLDDLERLLRDTGVRRVLVAFGRIPERQWIGLMRSAVAADVEIHVVPRFFDLGLGGQDVGGDEVQGIALQRIRPAASRRFTWMGKRAFDVAVAATALLALSPLLALVALAVRMSSPGPILFRQTRVGQHGKPFELLKFRSMPVAHASDTWSVAGAAVGPTRVGKVIRRTSIDELPQLWNILRGDMSVIGPRPERTVFVQRFNRDIPGYEDRHRLPVGLTGWAQVSGLRGDTSIPERVRYDNYYIDRWSLWFDVSILARTVLAVLRDFWRKAAY